MPTPGEELSSSACPQTGQPRPLAGTTHPGFKQLSRDPERERLLALPPARGGHRQSASYGLLSGRREQRRLSDARGPGDGGHETTPRQRVVEPPPTAESSRSRSDSSCGIGAMCW